MDIVKVVFQYKWHCDSCDEENIVIMDKNTVNIQYYKTVKCYCCGKEYKTKFSILTDWGKTNDKKILQPQNS
jgi:hypothetical protein